MSVPPGLLVLAWVVALFHVGLLLTWLELHGKLPQLGRHTHPEPAPDADVPLVSVIVPARDEEKVIGDCIRGVLAQRWPRLEVIVVDDRSSDRTPEILAEIGRTDERLIVVRGEECPPTWMGKNFALDQGFRRARGAWPLFLDADTRVAPELLPQTMAEALGHDVGLLTLIPGNVFRCFSDRVVNMVIFQAGGPMQAFDRIHDPADLRANANGPFMLFRRDCYEAIGGHAAIPYEVVEDLVLARNVKKAGFAIRWALAPELMQLELYESLRDLRRGWGKILQRAMEIDRREILTNALGALFMALFFAGPWIALPVTAGAWLAGGGASALLAMVLSAAACSAATTTQRFLGAILRVDDIHPRLQGLGALIVAELMLESIVRLFLKREMYWKGRLYHESEPA